MKQWDLEPGSRSCHTCGHVFAEEEEYWSVLLEPDVEQFSRRDFCATCKAEAPDARHSAWRTLNREIPKIPRSVIDPERAMELLEQLTGDDAGEPQLKLAYLVALLLMRRKVLVFAGSQDGDLKVRRRGQRKVWRIREFRLDPFATAGMESELSTLVALDRTSAASGESQSESVPGVGAENA